jgi:hypothetical protein
VSSTSAVFADASVNRCCYPAISRWSSINPTRSECGRTHDGSGSCSGVLYITFFSKREKRPYGPYRTNNRDCNEKMACTRLQAVSSSFWRLIIAALPSMRSVLPGPRRHPYAYPPSSEGQRLSPLLFWPLSGNLSRTNPLVTSSSFTAVATASYPHLVNPLSPYYYLVL